MLHILTGLLKVSVIAMCPLINLILFHRLPRQVSRKNSDGKGGSRAGSGKASHKGKTTVYQLVKMKDVSYINPITDFVRIDEVLKTCRCHHMDSLFDTYFYSKPISQIICLRS